MNRFAKLYQDLDETNATTRKVAAMESYFLNCEPKEGAWAVFFLSGRRIKRIVTTRDLRAWANQLSNTPDWLFESCYDVVGDLAETIALTLPPPRNTSNLQLPHWIEEWIEPLRSETAEQQQSSLAEIWNRLQPQERFVFNKLITGGFRVGVSRRLVTRALAKATGLETATIAHRLMGQWEPTAEFFKELCQESVTERDMSLPYPFCLAHPLTNDINTLGHASDWQIEWKWDGIRTQAIRRDDECFLWSRGEELMHDRFPEIESELMKLPKDAVVDGEILAWKDGKVLPFQELQRRLNRKRVGKKLLAEVPVKFLMFDVLEYEGSDIRQLPISERRAKLESLFDHSIRSLDSGDNPDSSPVELSPVLKPNSWDECAKLRDSSHQLNVEGLMLKRIDSAYGVGRQTGLWWKWKVDPYTCDAVLIYAQRGHGRRAGLYTDYTFAAWDDGTLVPFAKAYSGLTDSEIREVDRFIRQNTLEKFGPVRSVKPELVFEVAFEQVTESKRHKSGIAVRFPRIVRWRKDKRAADADELTTIQTLSRSRGD